MELETNFFYLIKLADGVVFLYMQNLLAFGSLLSVLCKKGNVFKSEDICSCAASWLITSEIFFPKIKIIWGLIVPQNNNRAWHFWRFIHHWISHVWAPLWNPELLFHKGHMEVQMVAEILCGRFRVRTGHSSLTFFTSHSCGPPLD